MAVRIVRFSPLGRDAGVAWGPQRGHGAIASHSLASSVSTCPKAFPKPKSVRPKRAAARCS